MAKIRTGKSQIVANLKKPKKKKKTQQRVTFLVIRLSIIFHMKSASQGFHEQNAFRYLFVNTVRVNIETQHA